MTSVIDGDEEVSQVRKNADDRMEPFLSPTLWKHIPRQLSSILLMKSFTSNSLRPRGIVTYMLAVIAERGAWYESTFASSLWR